MSNPIGSEMTIDLCEHNIPIRTCEICRDGVSQRSKETDDVLISRAWLTELMRDAYRYRFLRQGNSSHVMCGIWVMGPFGNTNDPPDEEKMDGVIDAAMETKGWK